VTLLTSELFTTEVKETQLIVKGRSHIHDVNVG